MVRSRVNLMKSSARPKRLDEIIMRETLEVKKRQRQRGRFRVRPGQGRPDLFNYDGGHGGGGGGGGGGARPGTAPVASMYSPIVAKGGRGADAMGGTAELGGSPDGKGGGKGGRRHRNLTKSRSHKTTLPSMNASGSPGAVAAGDDQAEVNVGDERVLEVQAQPVEKEKELRNTYVLFTTKATCLHGYQLRPGLLIAARLLSAIPPP